MDMLEDAYFQKIGMFKRWKDRLDMFERWTRSKLNMDMFCSWPILPMVNITMNHVFRITSKTSDTTVQVPSLQ